jgi:DNA-binding SARP family transcriptional activator
MSNSFRHMPDIKLPRARRVNRHPQGTAGSASDIASLSKSRMEAPLPQPPIGSIPAVGRKGPGGGLWLAALGPLEAWHDGSPLSLGPPARRAVLGLLLMEPGVMICRDAIIDMLWGEKPPSTAVGLVQAHVSKTRGILGPLRRAAGDSGVIDSVHTAYRLRLSDKELDLLMFRELAARADEAKANDDLATACDLYEQAVVLWRGDPLADVEMLHGHFKIAFLRKELSGVLLRYADAAFALSEYHRVLPRLRSLAAAEPLNEPVHAKLMIALAGSGYQAAAIRVYEDLRSRLDRELGLYPGDELAEAHVRVLRQDMPAGSRGRVHVLAIPDLAIPMQLPAAPRRFSGQDDELDTLSSLLEPDAEGSGGVVIAALTGMAGVGKTALAVRWAHGIADRFPDGQLFVNLHGFDSAGTPVAPADALHGFLSSLGVPAARIPPDVASRAALFRSLLADRRMLILLDDAMDAEQVRPLLPGSRGCMVLVTSRNQLTGLAAAEHAYLFVLGAL